LKKIGVKVLVKKTNEQGYITRRLDADNYEIWLESGDLITISPKEFLEIQGDKNE
jgi:translation initiation factor IF-1